MNRNEISYTIARGNLEALLLHTLHSKPRARGKASLVFKPKNTYTETLPDGRQAEIREYHFLGIYR